MGLTGTNQTFGITFIASVALLVVVGIAWAIDAGRQPRADLAGDAVVATETPTLSPPATIAPLQAKTATATATTVPAAEPSPPTTAFTAPAPSDPQRLTIPTGTIGASTARAEEHAGCSAEVDMGGDHHGAERGAGPGAGPGAGLVPSLRIDTCRAIRSMSRRRDRPCLTDM